MKKCLFAFIALLISLAALPQNVGVGTASPQAKLEVKATTEGDVFTATSIGYVQDVFTTDAQTGIQINGNSLWQGIVPKVTGKLHHLDLKISGATTSWNADITVTIFSGFGVGGAVVAAFTQSASISNSATNSDWVSLNVPGSVSLNAGSQYTVRVQSNGPSIIYWCNSHYDAYPDGPSYNGNALDLALKTFYTASGSFMLDKSGISNATKLAIGSAGSIFSTVREGEFTIGNNPFTGIKAMHVAFPSNTFTSTPKVIVTLKTEIYDDVFTESIRNVDSTGFDVVVYRVDNSGGTWGQNLKLQWMAWQ